MGDESERPDAGDDLRRNVEAYIRKSHPPPAEILELEFVYEALAHPRRRYLCYSLLSSSRWTLPELATKLVAWERDIPEADVAGFDRDEMYVSLHHAHVPKLVELDIIEYETGDEAIIIASANAPQVLAVLQGAGASIDALQEKHTHGVSTNWSDH
ncbi:DUF7344 domain-containing protein [Natronosalvus halobius]|uniref:DUF7344 domain-containing protein n=1 Tax=Natronosalvus halobius TaxID=2953746 RepID=UPI0020A01279|nr:hypothetical protein [Natronosalvus halobius]USZ73557.1 hypothetical protein NGM15_18020 [Natronosalvus halobius]